MHGVHKYCREFPKATYFEFVFDNWTGEGGRKDFISVLSIPSLSTCMLRFTWTMFFYSFSIFSCSYATTPSCVFGRSFPPSVTFLIRDLQRLLFCRLIYSSWRGRWPMISQFRFSIYPINCVPPPQAILGLNQASNQLLQTSNQPSQPRYQPSQDSNQLFRTPNQPSQAGN